MASGDPGFNVLDIVLRVAGAVAGSIGLLASAIFGWFARKYFDKQDERIRALETARVKDLEQKVIEAQQRGEDQNAFTAVAQQLRALIHSFEEFKGDMKTNHIENKRLLEESERTASEWRHKTMQPAFASLQLIVERHDAKIEQFEKNAEGGRRRS